jgi:endonuclease/exonuclease/phosphatase family metal-dependent hydrolase
MKTNVVGYLALLFLSCCVSNCVSKDYSSQEKSLTVMTYNVENLFDAFDDPDKTDETYLPIEKKQSPSHKVKCAGLKRDWWRKQCLETDWSESKIKRKLERLADVILQIGNGKGPDVLILQEVENIKILRRLNQEYLQAAAYKEVILIEGPDERGIDVAMLSRLPLNSKPKLNTIDLPYIDRQTGKIDKTKEARPTRGILQAQFKLPGGETLTALGVHFPSQGSPTPAREVAIAKLLEVKKSLPKDEYIIVGGDFNITAKEDSQHGLFSKKLASEFLVSTKSAVTIAQGPILIAAITPFLMRFYFLKTFKRASGRWIPPVFALPTKVFIRSIILVAPPVFEMAKIKKVCRIIGP